MTTASHRQPPGIETAGVGTAVGVLALVGAAIAVVALFAGEGPQLLGALFGAGLVAAFFTFGMLSTAVVAALAPRASMMVALLTYTLQVVFLALLLTAFARSGAGDSVDGHWLGGTVIAGTLAWMFALVGHARKAVER